MDEIPMKKYRKKAVIWTVVITLLIVAGLGIAFGTVVEGGLLAEIAKWALGGAFVSCITGFFAFIISPYVWLSKNGPDDDDIGPSPVS